MRTVLWRYDNTIRGLSTLKSLAAEQRCRRCLHRVDLELHKSRVRNIWDDTYDKYAIVKPGADKADYQYDGYLEDIESYVRDMVEPELLARSRER